MHKKILFLLALSIYSGRFFGQDSGFTGYATSRIEGGQVAFRSAGYMDREKARAYDTLTIQPVGSVSKVIIGLALMKAVELGFIHMDADINQYAGFRIENPNVKNHRPITMRHLATHTSGIIDNEKFYIQSYAKGLSPPCSLEEFLRSYLSDGGSRYSRKNFGKSQPGEEYDYSNIGAALAACLIERATGVPFDRFTETHIFQPLGMRHTHWFYDETKTETYARLYGEKDEPLDFYSLATYPEGGLKSNVVDLTRLLGALMEGYRGECEILRKESWKEFFAKNFSESNPVAGINPREPNTGIFVVYAKSGAIGHTGSDPGVCAMMFFNPQTNRGKVFLANEDLTSDNLEAFKEIWEKI